MLANHSYSRHAPEAVAIFQAMKIAVGYVLVVTLLALAHGHPGHSQEVLMRTMVDNHVVSKAAIYTQFKPQGSIFRTRSTLQVASVR